MMREEAPPGVRSMQRAPSPAGATDELRARARATPRSRAATLALGLVAGFLAGCAGSGSGFGLTRGASDEGRRALEIDCVGALAFAPDAQSIASSNGRTLRVRASPSGRTLKTLDLAGGRGGAVIAFAPGGRWLAASCMGDTAVEVFDTRDWSERALFLFGPERVGAIALSGDGAEIAVGTDTSRIALCTIETGAQRILRKPRALSSEEPTAMSFLAYGDRDRVLFATAGDETIGIDRALGDVLWSRAEERALAVSSDARRLVTRSTRTGAARIIETAERGEPAVACTLHDPAGPGSALTAAFAPDQSWIAIGYSRHFLGANWQELEFFRLTPTKAAKPGSSDAAETLAARSIRGLSAGEPRRIAVSPDGKLLGLCTTPTAGIYALDLLITRDELAE